MLVTHGLHGQADLLTNLQGENVRLVHRDGDGHAFAGVKGGQGGVRQRIGAYGQVVQGYQGFQGAGLLGHQAAVLIELHKLLVELFVVLPLLEQLVVFGGVFGVAQGEQGGGGSDLGILPGGNVGDGSGIAGDLQGAVNIQFPGQRAHGGGVAHQRPVVGNQHRGFAAADGVHRAVPLLAVGGGDGDGFAHGQRVGLNVYSQKSIQAQLCQAALVIHNVCHAVARFRIDGLDPSGNTGLDGGGNLVLAGLLELAVQVIQGVLNGGQAGQHGAGVGGGQKGARFNGVALLHTELFHLHGGGDGQVLHIVTGQAAAAGDGGLDGACGDGDGLDIAAALGRHGPLHPLPDIQCTGQSRYQDHGNNGDDPLNGFLPFLGFCWFGHREFLQNQLLMFIL